MALCDLPTQLDHVATKSSTKTVPTSSIPSDRDLFFLLANEAIIENQNYNMIWKIKIVSYCDK